MRVLFLLLAMTILSCKKEEVEKKEYHFLRSRVKFRATYINVHFANGCDSLFIEVKHLRMDETKKYGFKTHDNPCHNTSYIFNTMAEDSVIYLPYSIFSEHDTLEKGYLIFSTRDQVLVKS